MSSRVPMRTVRSLASITPLAYASRSRGPVDPGVILPLRGGSGIAVRLRAAGRSAGPGRSSKALARAAEAGASPAATHGRYGAGRPGLTR